VFNIESRILPTATTVASVDDAKKAVLIALSQIIDPDFGTDIVSCGFVKDLEISKALEEVKGPPSLKQDSNNE
jgi:metal-sulfur cluster biosynthetic enzyme